MSHQTASPPRPLVLLATLQARLVWAEEANELIMRVINMFVSGQGLPHAPKQFTT